jgi:hypothetical protein
MNSPIVVNCPGSLSLLFDYFDHFLAKTSFMSKIKITTQKSQPRIRKFVRQSNRMDVFLRTLHLYISEIRHIVRYYTDDAPGIKQNSIHG